MTADDELEQQRRATIRSLFLSLPQSFDACHAELKTLSGIFHDEMARALEPRLNAEMDRRPHEELVEQRELAGWVNYVLRSLRLAIRCPRTGKPATMLVDYRDNDYDLGRFRLEVRDDRGQSVKTVTSHELPVLQLREDRPRQQGSGRFGGGKDAPARGP